MEDNKKNVLSVLLWHFEFDGIPKEAKAVWVLENTPIEYLKARFKRSVCCYPNLQTRKELISFCQYAYTTFKETEDTDFHVFIHSDYEEFDQVGVMEVREALKVFMGPLHDKLFVKSFGKTSGADTNEYTQYIDPIRKKFNLSGYNPTENHS